MNPYDPPTTRSRLSDERQPLGFFEVVSLNVKLAHATGKHWLIVVGLLFVVFLLLGSIAMLGGAYSQITDAFGLR